MTPQIFVRRSLVRLMACAALVATLVGCASSRYQAPVEDRNVGVARGASPSAASASALGSDPARVLPGAENAGKPGYYTVKTGDTLIRIGLESGQNWRDIQRWNNLDNANLIEVGQVLRVVSPGLDATAVAAKPVTAQKVEARALDAKPGTAGTPETAAAASAGAAAASAAAAATATASAGASAVKAPAASGTDEEVNWSWPAQGAVYAGFDEARNKGLSIAGKAGDPVLAAGDGRVVYSGSGLRGYGNLVIIKHNDTYLTAYAHNQTLLVKEDQAVRRGQKIAEMGSTDADKVNLHFEVRRKGRPIDPAKVLPAR